MDIEDDNLIHILQDAEKEIAASGKVPRDFKQKLGSMSPQLESLWLSFGRKADDDLRKLCERDHASQKLSPEEYSAQRTWLMIVGLIEFIQITYNNPSETPSPD